MTTEYIGGHAGDAEPCCLCCGFRDAAGHAQCVCNCCACPYEGDLDFEMIYCSWTPVGTPGGAEDCMCDDWSFTMTQAPDMCYVHTSGGGCSPCDDQYQGSCFNGTDPDCLAYRPQYVEAWQWSGVVCDTCTTDSPPANASDCGGMSIRVSLCCCKTGVDSSATGHPCPLPEGEFLRCQPTGTVTPFTPGAACDLDCFWCMITPKDVYYINSGPLPDSPCSNCAAFPAAGGGGGSTPGTLQQRICMIPISGQCGCDICDPQKKFMLMVSGTFTINCDCQTGVYQSFGGGGGIVTPVMMTVVGLIQEA